MSRHLTSLSALALVLAIHTPECRAGWSWSYDPAVRMREVMAVVTVLMVVGFLYGANRILNPTRTHDPGDFLEEGSQPPGIVGSPLGLTEQEPSARPVSGVDDRRLWDRDLDGLDGPGPIVTASRGHGESRAALLALFVIGLRHILKPVSELGEGVREFKQSMRDRGSGGPWIA